MVLKVVNVGKRIFEQITRTVFAGYAVISVSTVTLTFKFNCQFKRIFSVGFFQYILWFSFSSKLSYDSSFLDFRDQILTLFNSAFVPSSNLRHELGFILAEKQLLMSSRWTVSQTHIIFFGLHFLNRQSTKRKRQHDSEDETTIFNQVNASELETYRLKELHDSDVYYIPSFIKKETSDEWYQLLLMLDSCTRSSYLVMTLTKHLRRVSA